jgi:hypothetical protein
MTYPEAAEVEAWGRPTFRAGKKVFLLFAAAMDNPYTIVFKPSEDDRPAYLQDDRFFIPKYWGPGGWLAMPVESPETDWTEVAELIDASYREVALARQLRALDERG